MERQELLGLREQVVHLEQQVRQVQLEHQVRQDLVDLRVVVVRVVRQGLLVRQELLEQQVLQEQQVLVGQVVRQG